MPSSAPAGDTSIDLETAQRMLLIDFEQAFVIHNDYKDSERDLFKLSLKILSFPAIIVGALLSARLISSVAEVQTVLQLPFIYIALVASGVLNTIVLRAYVVTDRVQTEAKHQVNRLRSLYLHALRERFPPGWSPVWGSTNPYLSSRKKLKAAVLTAVVMALINAGYVAFGVDRLLVYSTNAGWWAHAASAALGALHLLVQLELTWEVIRKLGRASRSGGGPGHTTLPAE